MIEIELLTQFKPDDFKRVITGYYSNAKFSVGKIETDAEFTLALELTRLPQPYVKRYEHLDAETLETYRQVLSHEFSFAAFDENECVGIALAEPRAWNNSLWVWEFHIIESYRGQGIGRRLMSKLIEKAADANLRIIVCETQNTNVPAIKFYRKAGFEIEGVDLSYYTNDDFPNGEIAVFMKKRISRPA